MATLPIQPVESSTMPEAVEKQLRHLESIWNAETAYLSSDSEIVAHPAFQEILKLGPAVVPLLLRDLEQQPSLWVWALPKITGVDPVPESDRGYIARMSEAWLRWGRVNGYRW